MLLQMMLPSDGDSASALVAFAQGAKRRASSAMVAAAGGGGGVNGEPTTPFGSGVSKWQKAAKLAQLPWISWCALTFGAAYGASRMALPLPLFFPSCPALTVSGHPALAAPASRRAPFYKAALGLLATNGGLVNISCFSFRQATRQRYFEADDDSEPQVRQAGLSRGGL